MITINLMNLTFKVDGFFEKLLNIKKTDSKEQILKSFAEANNHIEILFDFIMYTKKLHDQLQEIVISNDHSEKLESIIKGGFNQQTFEEHTVVVIKYFGSKYEEIVETVGFP